MKIKIKNLNDFMIFELNNESRTINCIKNSDNIILQSIFGEINYDNFISWVKSRTGGLSFSKIVELAKNNQLKSVKDNILVEIID